MLTIKQWRRAKGISLQKMADLLGVHVNTYTSWEENPQKITIGNAYKISEILAVNISDIDFLCNDTPQNVVSD